MKKMIIFMVVFTLAFVTLAIADKTTMEAKVGDELYVCACGEGCPCDTMSRNAGQCSCGKDMVKTKVTKVEEGKDHDGVEEQALRQCGKICLRLRTCL